MAKLIHTPRCRTAQIWTVMIYEFTNTTNSLTEHFYWG